MNIRYLFSMLLIILCISCKDDDSIALYNASVSVEADGGSFSLPVTSDAEITPVCPEWVKLEETVAGNGQYVFTFSVCAYYSKEGRKQEIYFQAANGQQSVMVIQQGMKSYVPSEDFSGFGELNDVQVLIDKAWSREGTSAKGQAEQDGPGVQTMCDGIKSNSSKMYNSPYDSRVFGNVSKDELQKKMQALFPHELKFTLKGGAERVDYMVYYPRPDGAGGTFGVIDEILVSTHDTPQIFVSVAKNIDCGMLGSARTIYFNKTIQNPHTVWVKVGSGKGDFISCTEMEFYGHSSQAFDTSTLFADDMCTTLKAGISLEEIEACPYPFFKNIALYMYYDCYETDFRIAEFKAWEHPSKAAAKNKTSTYSILDNPTGIYVAKGDKMVTMVGDMYNQSVSLRVVNLNTPGKDGFDTNREYSLKPGVNIHTVEIEGLVYVMYHTNAYQTVKPIKMHFASGKVNGYFDICDEKHNKPEEWFRLLKNASSPYFDALGQYAHITFPVSNLNAVTDPVEWVKFYDNLVYKEQEFMGLKKYDKMFKNRMYFNVMYNDSYMYSTSYRTSYSIGTIDGLSDLSKLHADPWGPAHEVGHSNQTRPGLKWTGMTEVTNNILSMYIQRITNGASRLEIKGYYPHAMTTAFTGRPHIIVGKINEKDKADVFCQVVPFWQLQLYMAYVLGKDDFYQDLYEAVRLTTSVDDTKKNAGEHQLEFAYLCSKAAGLDLTEFFEKWGFLRKVDLVVKDYGTLGTFKINDTNLAAMKKRIAGLGLPKPTHNYEYITEQTEKVFKENLPMNTTGATVKVDRDSDVIAVSGCSNVVAYELYDKETRTLVCVSPVESTFTLDKSIFMPKKVEVRAVPASGESKVIYSE